MLQCDNFAKMLKSHVNRAATAKAEQEASKHLLSHLLTQLLTPSQEGGGASWLAKRRAWWSSACQMGLLSGRAERVWNQADESISSPRQSTTTDRR